MSQIAPDFWTALSPSASSGDDWQVRPPLAEICPRLLGSVARSGERRFLVALAAGEESVDDSRSRGFRVGSAELVDDRGATGRYVVIECRDAAGHDLFDVIGVDLAFAIATHPPAIAITRVLAKWRRFWGQLPRPLLSRDAQVGLFAELWFFSRWMVPAAGPAAAATRWRGPLRSRHDFEWIGRSVEVKGSSIVRNHLCHVNGLDQLEPPENGELLLFALRIRDEAGAAHVLPQLITECRALLAADRDALAVFETALLQTDYSAAHEADYAQTRWRVVDERLYRVDENFSRLRPSHFPSGLPPGVSEVGYTLDVSAAGGDFVSLPAAAVTLLR
ncbi:MAG TPA: PD-(D/E)XK motif protein [Candidatus Didemnitutus sp.]